MKLTRLIFVLAALLALVAVPANAQITGSELGCGSLSDADCELLRSQAIAPSGEFAGLGSLNVSLDGTPFAAGVSLEGSYISDADIVADYTELQTMTTEEVFNSIYTDQESFVTFITDFFQIVDSDMTLGVELPAELGLPTDWTLDLYLVNGVAYADLAPFTMFDPSLEGIYGIDLVALYTDIFSDPEMEEVFSMMFSGEDGMMSESLNMFADPAAFGEFITVTRMEDDVVDGVEVAMFESALDYGALFESDAFRDMIDTQMEMVEDVAQEEGESDVFGEVDPDAIIDLYAVIFADTTLTTTTALGLEDGYVYSTTLAFNMSFDPDAVEAALVEIDGELGETSPMQGVPPVVIDFDMSITQSGFGAVEEIPLPEAAEVLPMEMFGL